MTSPAYSITTRTIVAGPGGALIMGPQDPDFVRVIEDIHVCLPSSPPECIVQIGIQQAGGFTGQLILNEDLAIPTTGELPANYLQSTGQWAVLPDEDVVGTIEAGTVTGIITLGLRVYRAGRVLAFWAEGRDTEVALGGPVPAGQRWLIRDVTVSSLSDFDPGPCPWSAGSAVLGSTGQVAGTVIASHDLPDTPALQHLTPRIVLDQGETFIGQKPFGGSQLLSWRVTAFVLEPPLQPEPV